MKITNNFSDASLLFNEPVSYTLYTDDDKAILAHFDILLPTVRDLHFNDAVGALLGILRQSVAELNNKMHLPTPLDSHIDFINQLKDISKISPETAIVFSKIVKGLNTLCPSCSLIDDQIKIKNLILTDELLESFRNIWLMATGNKAFSMAYKYLTPQERAIEEKIQAIKNQGKNIKGQENDNGFEKAYIILTYEFGYSKDEILNMTMHTVKRILKYTSKSINYKLTLVAKANGNTKKVKFITDKGD